MPTTIQQPTVTRWTLRYAIVLGALIVLYALCTATIVDGYVYRLSSPNEMLSDIAP